MPDREKDRIDFDEQMQQLAEELDRQANEETAEYAVTESGQTGEPRPAIQAKSDPELLALLGSVADKLDKKNSLESANQKLFDSMHKELEDYRDGFIFETMHQPVIKDMLALYDDLKKVAAQTTKHQEVGEWSADVANNVENLLHSLSEILYRLDVSRIDIRQATENKKLQRVMNMVPTTESEEDGEIVEVLRDGFMWRERVLRPLDVVVKRYSAK